MMLSNYKEHPTKSNYLVFTYTNINMVNYFQKLLKEQNIEYVLDDEGYDDNNTYMIAVKTTYRKQAVKNNFLAYGKFRKPTFGRGVGKYLLIAFLVGLITFSLIGFFLNKRAKSIIPLTKQAKEIFIKK